MEGGVDRQQQVVKENVGKGGVHRDDVGSCFLVKHIHCFHRGMLVVVGAHGVIRHIGDRRRIGCKMDWVYFCHQENIHIGGGSAERQVHCH